jgi:3-isopropylmalate dehydrogenase
MIEIPVLLGDGIGPEIVGATQQVMAAACEKVGISLAFSELPCGLDAIRTHGTTMPAETLDILDQSPGWILGPLTTHVYAGTSGEPNVSAMLRKRYNLFANLRPVRGRAQACCAEPAGTSGFDVLVVRENTEGFYADRNLHLGHGEFMPTPDVALAVRVITRAASMNVARAAFRQAEARSGRVTIVHKANVLRVSDGLFVEVCGEIAEAYPRVQVNDLHVDAAATKLTTNPHAFDVILTTNMFGDILSNLVAGLAGSLGLAPSLNEGNEHAMAQASHGSAPDIAGTGQANPIAEILSGAMLLGWLSRRLGEPLLAPAAASIDAAVQTVLAAGRPEILTPDLGGSGSTASVTDALLTALGG